MGVLLAAVLFFGYLGYGLLSPQLAVQEFGGEEAMAFVRRQLELGPRTTGSETSAATVDWFIEELRGQRWRVIVQPYNVPVPVLNAAAFLSATAPVTATLSTALAATGTVTVSAGALAAGDTTVGDMIVLEARNVIAIREPAGIAADAELPTIVLAAPYDSRLIADADRSPEPSPGANIGAAGAAVLLELAHTLNVDLTNHRICLVFLDSEANRGLPGWQSPFGANLFLQEANDEDDDLVECSAPRLAVVLEAVGGENHRLQVDPASDAALSGGLWQAAESLDLGDQFVPVTGQPLPGAHNTFVAAGIPTVAVFEQGYPYRHSSEDTLDKISENSLDGVGNALQVWLESGARAEGP